MRNKKIFLCLKVLVAATVLWLLLKKTGIDAVLTVIRASNPLAFIAAVLMAILTTYLSAVRLKLLIPLATRTEKLFSIYYIAAFFNTCLPGTVGGDVLKTYYLARYLEKVPLSRSTVNPVTRRAGSTPTRTTLAVGSVIMDRYIGLFMLVVISIVILPFGMQLIRDPVVRLSIFVVYGAFFVLTFVFFGLRLGSSLGFLGRLYEYFRVCLQEKRVAVRVFIYSVIVQLIVTLSVYTLSLGLRLDVSLLSIFVFLPLVTLFSLIPLSISGIGFREGAFVFLFSMIGVPKEKAISLSILWFLSLVVASLPGLFLYLQMGKAMPSASLTVLGDAARNIRDNETLAR